MTKKQAIEWAGGVAQLAKKLGLSRQAVHQWPKRKQIPALRRYQIRDMQAQEQQTER